GPTVRAQAARRRGRAGDPPPTPSRSPSPPPPGPSKRARASVRRARPPAAATRPSRRPEGLEGRRIARDRGDLRPDATGMRDQQHLVDVELSPEPPAPRAVDGDRVLVVGERPAELAQVRAVGEPTCLAKELEDARPALVPLRDRDGAVDDPDGVLGDHLEQCAWIAAAE